MVESEAVIQYSSSLFTVAWRS